ncbi:hypothetical protein KHO57_gp037 [Mycobacterium phage Phabba]|uniref:Uncharacterized protein n=1 Tax=Mycobacterium phage Phabba TaxID=2027899 RepID=A0A249XS84_9CAUD|nr:hypothetical protein KHO57_gp037 [Mycobacterium phage Phabba]ASZ74612.1 hypothetical protein SEA_PHABBA_37 [Mycobacterium phage Phabba]
MEKARAKVAIWQNRLDDIYDETVMKMRLENQA